MRKVAILCIAALCGCAVSRDTFESTRLIGFTLTCIGGKVETCRVTGEMVFVTQSVPDTSLQESLQ